MKKKRGFSFREEYRASWNYIKDSRKFIYVAVALFVFFLLVGVFVPAPLEIQKQIYIFIEELVAKTSGLSAPELVQFIFLNNLQSGFIGLASGFFLGIFPVLITIVNGYVVGFVINLSVSSDGILTLWKLFPHGIFELPAVFISFGLGLKLGTFVLHKKKIDTFEDFFWNSLRVFIFVVIPLLVIAAIIEGSLIFFVQG